jgi:hypothetical protein|tara:strand:- start:209 stop:346 length:138 start_codon:yes stop_codon:yes gene_type:complete
LAIIKREREIIHRLVEELSVTKVMLLGIIEEEKIKIISVASRIVF